MFKFFVTNSLSKNYKTFFAKQFFFKLFKIAHIFIVIIMSDPLAVSWGQRGKHVEPLTGACGSERVNTLFSPIEP